MRFSRPAIALISLVMLTNSACLFRSRKVESRMSKATLLTASPQQLIERVNAEAARIKTMNATVDIDTSVGGEKKGKVTEYQEIRGYILAEKPLMLRMVGLFPIVRNRAFDMVSNGQEFKLWIPPKNRFIVGTNEIVKPSPNPLENLRPQVIYDALLLREIDPKEEVAVNEIGTQDVQDPKDAKKSLQQPNYELHVIRRDGKGGWYLSRKIFFDRTSLEPYRQVIYDKDGNVATDASYTAFRDYEGIQFPQSIVITRPQEEYTIGLKMVNLKLNTPLKPEQFELARPAGSELKVLNGATQQEAASGK